MENMRAKFKVDNVKHIEECEHIGVTLSAVCSDETLENQSFNQATPYGELKMMIDNPAAKNYFVEGQEFYLDFTRSE